MNEPKSFCPGCKSEVVFENVGDNIRRCPACGFQYMLTGTQLPVGTSPWSGVEETFGILFRAFLIMVGIVVVGLGIAFAGCALMMGR